MNEEMRAAMELDGSSHPDPEAPIPIPQNDGSVEMMTPEAIAAHGLAMSAQYMKTNGPTRPIHVGQPKVMTKAQLEEQKMNEKQGYPSNLDEAAKVKELESKVGRMEAGISQILNHLQGQPSPAIEQPVEPSGGHQVYHEESPIPTQVPYETSRQQSPLEKSWSDSSEPESKQPKLREVTLSDGRKISVPRTSSQAMNLGPVGDGRQAPPTQPGPVDEDDTDDPWADEPVVEQEFGESQQEQAPDPRVARVQQLVQDVVSFLRENDVHRAWRRVLSRSVHRNVGYNGWPKELQQDFDKNFQSLLNDSQFITSVCRKVDSMEMGHGLGPKVVASLIISAAGFTAFTLSGLE